MDRKELAHFLRAKRARLRPRDVGLPEGARRRTPGLRRQEVAELAGISVDYYIRLEQGRGPQPSRQVLNALARALLLTADERAHLLHLACEAPIAVPVPTRVVPQSIRHLLVQLTEVPAIVTDIAYEILAWNPLGNTLLGDLEARPAHDRNVIRWIFRAPDVAERLRDPEERRFVQASVADLRAAAGKYPHDQGIRDLVAELLGCSPEFAALWRAHEVRIRRDQRKTMYHPLTGRIELTCQVLPLPDGDLRLVLFIAEPGSPAAEALRRIRAALPA